jgi:hypothetical protein
MGLKAKARGAMQAARAELSEVVKQASEQKEIREAREALARRKLPPEERATAKAKSDAGKAERRAHAQEQARVKAAEFRQRSEQARRAAAEAQKREEATLRRDGRLLGATEAPEGARLGDVCKVVLDPDGIKVEQANRAVVDIPWTVVRHVEVEDATMSMQRSKTRQRVGRMGGVFKFAQFVPVAETKTITDRRADILIESDRGAFYLQLLRTEHRVLKGWLMGTEGRWKGDPRSV